MDNTSSYHSIAIRCKSCRSEWEMDIAISGNVVEAFAAVCSCSNLIVGNYNYAEHKKILAQSIQLSEQQLKRIYLTNGHFTILDYSREEKKKLAKLEAE
ncbi:MAG: hypothetical protein ACW98K_02155 [Candidatus Kariarchaeaceae archaeon]